MKNKKEINFKIAGGLGNQIFMLCAGLYFQQTKNRTVTFDISDLERVADLHPGKNIFNLGLIERFQIEQEYPNKNKNSKFEQLVRKIVRKYSRRIIPRKFLKEIFINEVGYYNLDKIENRTTKVFGYFQSWRYYEALMVKPVFSIELLPEPSSWFFEMEKQLKRKNIAAFHIRRGDYTLAINRSSGILALEYFENIARLLPNDLEIWIFTDSPELIIDKVNGFPQKTVIINPPGNSDPFESLLLLSKASYIAISNSTFSWWAAAIAGEKVQIFAPSKWFEHRDDPLDLIPEKWKLIESQWEGRI
jgi:hypothetical protein